MQAAAPRPLRRPRARRRPSILLLLSVLLTLLGPGAQAACLVDYRVTNQWGNGFTAEVRLTNQDAVAWSGWSASWTMPDGQQVTGLWNGSHSQNGAALSVSNAGWNAGVAAGADVSFGFNASHTGANGIPWDIAVNGETCAGQAAPPPPSEPVTACTVDYRVREDWGSGATIDIDVRNDGDPLTGWTLAWTMPDGQQITGGWNGSFTQSGAAVQVTPAGWNQSVAAGADIGIGFNLSHGGSNRIPGDVALNGVPCAGQVPPPDVTDPPEPEPIACVLDYRVREDWGHGATIDVTLHNTGRQLSDWTIAWTMPAGQTITGLWNGVHQQDGSAVSVRPAGWNGTIAPAGQLDFGFNVAHGGFNPPPIDLTIDGVRCEGQPEDIVFPPLVPQGLAASVVDNAHAVLTWTAVPGDPERLELQRRADGGTWTAFATLPGDAVETTDTAMALEVAYDYRLRTVNAAGSSAYGNVARAKLRDRSVIPVTALADTCAVCHGTDGASGGAAVPSIAGLGVDYFVGVMQAYRDGTRFATVMDRIAPGYTDAQTLALAEHFAALPFTDTEQTTDPLLAAFGAELHDQVCWICHGVDGEDASLTGVRLAGQWRTYLETTLLDFAEGLSPSQPAEMADEVAYLHGLHGAEAMTALAHFYAGGYPGGGDGDGGGGGGGESGDGGTGGGGGTSGGGNPDLPPAAPASLTARLLASGAVELGWTDQSNNELGFRIERADAGGPWTQLLNVGAGVQVHQDPGVLLGTRYDYRVSAVNLAGSSDAVAAAIELPTLAQFGAIQYADFNCGACHGDDGAGGFVNRPLNLFDAGAFASLAAITEATMPPSDPDSCNGLCAESLAAYMIEVLSADTGGGGGSGGGGAVACAGTEPAGVQSLRLLTRREYQNTVNDLLGLELDLINRLPVENRILGFDNNVEHNRVTPVHFETYLGLAEELAATAVAANRAGLVPCTGTDAACAAAFVDGFGRRAFRRPLTDDERGWYLALFTGRGFDDALRLGITSMLASPSFLYRSELGELEPDGSYKLTGYELAAALSYLFHGTLPDDALLAAAGRGELDTATGLITQAARLLASPRARARTGEFAGQWLLARDPYESPSKDPAAYPAYTAEVAAAMAEELMHFFNHVVFDSSGGFEELLTADYALVNPVLAAYYGLPAPPGDDFAPVPVTDGSRLGVMTLGAVMANYASADASHPFKRGAFFLNRMLCQELPPVGNMGVQVPPPDPTLTTRERFDIHSSSNQVCYDCHQYLDGPGFAFEHYDGAGRWRSTDNGQPVDASGVLRGLETFQPTEEYVFADLAQMNAMVAGSERAAQCLAVQYYRFATGHEETAADSCALDALQQHYADNGYDIQTLLLGIVNSRAFTHRRPADAP